ncbi:MAG: protein kinase [Anaerolinea sp.]|nr:protein kinase [Anaerolinea sp.]MCC6972775.1 protein kinase [Anaerolineae bacterium]CAG0956397.1 eukaryotic-like serine/threonine-protein kinase [Anaerolineae bacterium]
MSGANPYISRGPVRQSHLFFGRVHEMQEIAAFVRGNQSIAVVGQRKIGKTSLLFHLMRPETRETYNIPPETVIAYLDCEVLGTSTTEEIFGQFSGEIAATLSEMGLPAEPALETAIQKPSRLAFEGALRKLNQRGLRIVLILDEFERLSTNTQLDVNFFNALRSAAGRYPLVFITAAARPLIELTYSGQAQEILSSPFFNIFAPLFLGLLSGEDSYCLITELSSGAGVTFSEEVINFIYELAGGHPLALQVACFHAFNMPDNLSMVEESTTRELNAHFQYYWRNLTQTEQEALIRLNEASARVHNDTTLRAALRDLVQKCLLVQEDGLYRYPSRAWADFVSGQVRRQTATFSNGGLLTGTRFGSYEVNEMIGRGGMAEVYKGRHTRLDRVVAIKVLSPGLASDPDFRMRFEREARAIAALKHPNIVGVFDFGDLDEMYYMVMEYVPGETLSRFMQLSAPLPAAQVRVLAKDVAHALDYAHGQGFVHRDVKPSNVMLEPVTADSTNDLGLRAILTDFGIAKLLKASGSKTRNEGITGTLDYMAPEQIRSSADVDGRADVYALGVVVFQMLTGQLPFPGDHPGAVMLGHLQTMPPDPRTLVSDIPEYTAKAVLRALAKDPDDRFSTAGALVAAM